jgi:hypothetical protein
MGRLLCLLILGLWTACGAPPQLRRQWQPEEGLEALLYRSEAELAGIEDLSAQAEIRLAWEGERHRATASVLYKRPGLFRLEVRGGPFYTRLFTAVRQGDSLAVLPRKGPGWKGPIGADLLGRYTGVRLRGYDLDHALLGLVLPASLDSLRPPQYPRADRAMAYLDDGQGRFRRLWLDLYSGLVQREELLGWEDRVLLERTLTDYVLVEGLHLPRQVQIRQGENTIELHYQRYSANTGLEAERFMKGIREAEMQRVD